MKSEAFSLAFVGCGNMGSAVLLGLLDATSANAQARDEPSPKITFSACTNTEKSAVALQEKLGCHSSRVKVIHGDAVAAAAQADVVVLGVKPYMARDLFSVPGFVEALRGKLVISMLAGIDIRTLQTFVGDQDDTAQSQIHFARAVPNLAARHRASSTIVEDQEYPLPPNMSEALHWIFNQVGKTKALPPHLMDLGTVFNTACLTMVSVGLEGLLDGCVASGMKRQDAMAIATEGLSGLSALLANGSHPAVIRESASSPKGCTIQTLVSLERAGVRGSYADALITGVKHLS